LGIPFPSVAPYSVVPYSVVPYYVVPYSSHPFALGTAAAAAAAAACQDIPSACLAPSALVEVVEVVGKLVARELGGVQVAQVVQRVAQVVHQVVQRVGQRVEEAQRVAEEVQVVQVGLKNLGVAVVVAAVAAAAAAFAVAYAACSFPSWASSSDCPSSWVEELQPYHRPLVALGSSCPSWGSPFPPSWDSLAWVTACPVEQEVVVAGSVALASPVVEEQCQASGLH